MKITDLVENIMQDLKVLRDGPTGTELVGKDGVKITVPKKAGEKGMISQNDQGDLVLDPEADGKSDDIKPGTKVKVQPGGMGTNKRSF